MRSLERWRVAERARIEGYHQAAEQFKNLFDQMQRLMDQAHGIANDLARSAPARNPIEQPTKLEDL